MLPRKKNLHPTKTEFLFAPQNWGERGVCGGGRRGGGSGFHPSNCFSFAIAIVNKLSTYKVDFVINIFAYSTF